MVVGNLSFYRSKVRVVATDYRTLEIESGYDWHETDDGGWFSTSGRVTLAPGKSPSNDIHINVSRGNINDQQRRQLAAELFERVLKWNDKRQATLLVAQQRANELRVEIASNEHTLQTYYPAVAAAELREAEQRAAQAGPAKLEIAEQIRALQQQIEQLRATERDLGAAARQVDQLKQRKRLRTERSRIIRQLQAELTEATEAIELMSAAQPTVAEQAAPELAAAGIGLDALD